jgi:hypothetical protein
MGERMKKALPDGAVVRSLRTEAAAHYLGVSASLLRQWRRTGSRERGPEWIRVSHGIVLYDIGKLDEWLDAKREATAAA